MRSTGLLILAMALLALSVVVVPSTTETVVLEAEGYADLIAPMRVVRNAKEASGQSFVELPLGVGQGWRGEGSGSVIYRVDLPAAGAYTIWARALWKDGCTNAFFLTANEAAPLVFGNDAIFSQWHWVKGPSLPLESGLNYLTFSNHSDGTALDKLIITNDPFYLPEGLGQGITSFYDGFAGCDADNTGSWELRTGKWRVVHAAQEAAGPVNDCLAQWSPEGGLALGGFPVWQDYDARVKVMQTSPGAVALEFYRDESGNQYRLLWDNHDEVNEVRLERTASGETETIARQQGITCTYDHWYELGYYHDQDSLRCTLDGAPIASVKFEGPRRGQIGLACIETGGVYFDNVEVRFHGK